MVKYDISQSVGTIECSIDILAMVSISRTQSVRQAGFCSLEGCQFQATYSQSPRYERMVDVVLKAAVLMKQTVSSLALTNLYQIVIQGRNITQESTITLGSSSLYVNLTTSDIKGTSQTYQTSVTSNRINSNWNVEFDMYVDASPLLGVI